MDALELLVVVLEEGKPLVWDVLVAVAAEPPVLLDGELAAGEGVLVDLSLICLGESVTKMAEFGSDAPILAVTPWRAGKNLE